ncbi:MAG: hypothetical protein M5R42_02155 [Rhodocyclaceae bacterium]|nr:hypothetical protein [Rhodocyclaceae bacterium]
MQRQPGAPDQDLRRASAAPIPEQREGAQRDAYRGKYADVAQHGLFGEGDDGDQVNDADGRHQRDEQAEQAPGVVIPWDGMPGIAIELHFLDQWFSPGAGSEG